MPDQKGPGTHRVHCTEDPGERDHAGSWGYAHQGAGEEAEAGTGPDQCRGQQQDVPADWTEH